MLTVIPQFEITKWAPAVPIKTQDDGTCLVTVVHDQLENAPKTAVDVAGAGWMHILSGLKTLLETGSPLFDYAR